MVGRGRGAGCGQESDKKEHPFGTGMFRSLSSKTCKGRSQN